MAVDVSKASIEEKVGQLVMCGFEGGIPSAEITELIQQNHIGGVIYFSRNVQSVKQVHKLSRELQHLASAAGKPPLFLSIDQEGGMVARITEGVTLFPGNMALGAARNPAGAYQAAQVCGKELRALGINVNFSPSLDVNNNPFNPVIGVRSYSEQAELVSEMGVAALQGYQEAGVAATVKHFPGHGDTVTDSHLSLPVVCHTPERLYELELVPFRKAIFAGVDAIMTAHVVFPALDDSCMPSTLSTKIINGLLRTQLGFEGVVFTDCMEMKAISEHYGTERAAVFAVEAGADVVLISHRLDRQLGAIRALVEAVKSGRISEEQINRSVERIVSLKKKRKMNESMESWDSAALVLRQESSLSLARELSEQSVTVVKDDQRALPLKGGERTYVIWMDAQVTSLVDESLSQKQTLGNELNKFLPVVYERQIATDPSEEEQQLVLQESGSAKQIVIATYNTAFYPKQKELVEKLKQRENAKVVVVALRNPYDLLQFPDVSTYVACYESRPLALQSVAKVLAGNIKAKGKLPVSLSEKYPFGWSLFI